MTLLILSNFTYSQFGYVTVNNAFPINPLPTCGEVDSCFTLTLNQNQQSGAVWDTKLINLNNSFDASFCLYFGDQNGWGADGIAFVMRGDNLETMGNLGFGLGAESLSPTLIVELDTWQNTEPGVTDLAVDHTALYFNGNFATAIQGPTPLLPSNANVDDAATHTVRVKWNATTQVLQMFFDGFLRMTYSGDIINTVFAGNNIVKWGFTASTGGVNNLQQICFPKYTIVLDDIVKCENEDALISYYDPNITSYRWTFEDGTIIKDWNTLDYTTPFNLTDSSFTTSQAGTYYFDLELNNQVINDSVVVTDVPLPLEPFQKNILFSCLADDNFSLNALNNGSSYLWSTGQTSQQIGINNPGTYFVRITEPINACKYFDTIKIITFCKDTVICQNNAAEISFFEQGISSYKWYFQDGTVIKNWNNIDFTTPFNLNDTVFYPTVTGRYYLEITIDGENIIDSLDLLVVPNPIKPFPENIKMTCFEDGNFILNAQNPGSSYLWSTTQTSQQISVLTEGTYSVSITEPINSCVSLDTLKIINFCKDTSICDFDFATISFFEENLTSYKWSFEDGTVFKNWNNTTFTTPFNLNDTIFYPEEAGTYFLDIRINNDVLRDSFELNVVQNPSKPFSEEAITSCFFQTNYVLNANNNGSSYLWSTGDTTVSILVANSGTYWVEITEPILSCKNSDTLEMINFCKTEILCPNIFTPNNDLINEYYEVKFTNDFSWIADFEFIIFNRWGEQVYSVKNEMVKWNGKISDTELTNGVYFYKYSYKDAFSSELFKGSGNIQVVR